MNPSPGLLRRELFHSSMYFGTAGMSSGRSISNSRCEKISIFPDGVFSGCASGSARKASNETSGFVSGGLMATATGWGWQQLSPNLQLARDLPGNRLLVPLGLSWSLETVGKTGDDGYLTEPRPERFSHAGKALEALLAGGMNAVEKRQVEIRLAGALGALPDHEPLLILPLRALLESEGGSNTALSATLIRNYGERKWRPLGERWHEWQALGPIVHAKGGKSISEIHPPERGLRQMALNGAGPDLEDTVRGKGGRIGWTTLEVRGDGRDLDVGQVQFAQALTPPRDENGWTGKAAGIRSRGNLSSNPSPRWMASSWRLSLAERRQDGVAVAFVELEFDLQIRNDVTASRQQFNDLLGGNGWTINSAEFTVAYKGEGLLTWDRKAGRAVSLTLDFEITETHASEMTTSSADGDHSFEELRVSHGSGKVEYLFE